MCSLEKIEDVCGRLTQGSEHACASEKCNIVWSSRPQALLQLLAVKPSRRLSDDQTVNMDASSPNHLLHVEWHVLPDSLKKTNTLDI